MEGRDSYALIEGFPLNKNDCQAWVTGWFVESKKRNIVVRQHYRNVQIVAIFGINMHNSQLFCSDPGELTHMALTKRPPLVVSDMFDFSSIPGLMIQN